MSFTWTHQPADENYVQRWFGTADGDVDAEVAEVGPGGPWAVTVQQGGAVIGSLKTAGGAEEAKRIAEELAG